MSKKNNQSVYTKEEQRLVEAGILKDGVIVDSNFRWPKKTEQLAADKQYSEQKLKKAEEEEMARLTKPTLFDKGIDAIARMINRNKMKKEQEKEKQKKEQARKIAQERFQKTA